MKTDIKNLYKLRSTKIILGILAALIAALTIFQAGIFVGYHRAAFSYSLGDRYYRAFDRDDTRGGFRSFRNDFPGGNGAVGSIIRISLPTFVVETPDNIEKIIRVNDDTLIRKFRDTASTSDLAIGERIIVLGTPNDQAEINAHLIRIIPPLPTGLGTTTASTTQP